MLSNWTTVPVHGKFTDELGEPVVGNVTFTPAPTRLIDAALGTIIIPNTISVTLDGNGEFTVDLPATDDADISPTGWTYTVVEGFTGGTTYSISVPSSMADDGIELVAASHVSPNVGLPGTITLSAFNALAANVTTLISQFNGGTVWSALQPGMTLDGGFA